MISELLNSPFWGIVLTMLTYKLGCLIQKKAKGSPFANPLLISVLLIVAFLLMFQIPLDKYMIGGEILNFFLVPISAMLGVNIYNQRAVLKQYFAPVVGGCIAGAFANIGFILGVSKLLSIDNVFVRSILSRSVTTPIALALSEQIGGIAGITMLSILITGVTGAVLSPILVKLFRLHNPVATGVAIGASSHALGTVTAMKLGDVEGSVSSVSIGISGLVTVIIFLFF